MAATGKKRGAERLRLVLGRSNGLVGASSPALPLTILDAKIDAGGAFEPDVAPGHSQWIHAVEGSVEIFDGVGRVTIRSGEARSVGGRQEPVTLVRRASTESQIVIVTGEPIKEAFVQAGPFVMTTENEALLSAIGTLLSVRKLRGESSVSNFTVLKPRRHR